MASSCKVLVMAAGTGGHVFPALSIAQSLINKGAEVHWLATQTGMENDLLLNTSFPIHRITVSGLRGSGVKRKLLAPWMLLRALWQSFRVIRDVKPDCVLGMGGFVCGPAGIAAKAQGVPLLLHEQNAVAGLTNKILHRISTKTLAAFPGGFEPHKKLLITGNPVRANIEALYEAEADNESGVAGRALRILVLGGSQGAKRINEVVPEVLKEWKGMVPQIWHQTGERSLADTRELYRAMGVDLAAGDIRVVAFIDDMSAAYAWADIVVCRSGASTVCELAVAGLPSILVPYPYHKDQQQLHNANWLVNNAAALLLEQHELTVDALSALLQSLLEKPETLSAMRANARSLAQLDVAGRIADLCLEFGHES